MVRSMRNLGICGILIAGATQWALAQTNFSRINGFEPQFIPPVTSRVANIKTSYGAKGDGTTDDTQAFKNALVAGQMFIYIPAGTYLIKDQLRVRDGIKRTTFIGEKRTTTVLKLADNSPGFNNPAVPKAFLHTRAPAQFGEQNFHHYVLHLTLEIGAGNTGAVGLNHHTNNTGQVKDVCVRASDPVNSKPLRGIAFDDWWYGPGGGRYLEVDGFKTGIYVASAQNHVTIEHVDVRNCDVGLEIQYYPDTVFTVSCRRLAAQNCGMGVKNGGSLALIESNLAGSGAAAIDNRGSLLCRAVNTSGFTKAIASTTSAGDIAGPNIPHYSSEPAQYLWTPAAGMDQTIGLPFEESPEQQYPSSASGWSLIGATGDVGAAVNQAIAGGATDIFLTGGTISTTIALKGSVRRVMGVGSRPVIMNANPTYRLEDGTPPVVVIEFTYADFASTGGVVEQASKRTLVYRHGAGQYRTATAGAGGKVFVESIVGTFAFNGVKAWCRDINTEGTGTEVTSTNSTLVILGHRTEKYATKVTVNGGYAEVLGGSYRETYSFGQQIQNGIDTANPPPLFLVNNANASFHFRNSDCYLRPQGYVFKWSVKEIRGSETRVLPATHTLCGAVPLVVCYSQRPEVASILPGVGLGHRTPLSRTGLREYPDAVLYDVQGRKVRTAGRQVLGDGMRLSVHNGTLRVLSPFVAVH